MVKLSKNRGAAKIEALRKSTVEPVLGTLKQYMGLRQVNTIGINKANTCMHIAATAYNVKKYLKFKGKTPISIAGVVHRVGKDLQPAFLALKWALWVTINYLKVKYEPLMLKIP